MAMKTVKFAITMIGLFFSSAALPANLYQYAYGNGISFFYDADTIRRNGDRVSVWTTWDGSKSNIVAWRESKNKILFDCRYETASIMAFVNYAPNGTVMKSGDYDDPDLQSIVPGSTVDALFKIIC
jgi:hypothetical protein